MIAFEKFGQHQPREPPGRTHAREGVEISLSTLADQIGAVAAALQRPAPAAIDLPRAARLLTCAPFRIRGRVEPVGWF
jgi:transposase